MAFRGWTTHVAFEYLAGHALRLNGARCHYVVCGGGLPISELGRPRSQFPEPCVECRAYVVRMLEAGGFPYSTIDDLVSEEEREQISREVQAHSDLTDFKFQGLLLASFVKRSAMWHLRSGLAARNPNERREFREFVESGAIVALAFERLLDQERPEAIVMGSGLFFAEAILDALAKRRGIPVVSYDFAIRAGTVFLSTDLPASLFDMTEWWEKKGRRPPTAEERGRVADVITSRTGGGRSPWQSFAFDERSAPTHEDGRTHYVVFTNVSWDTAIAMRDLGFDDMYDWLDAIIDWARPRQDVVIDVRVHPGETREPGFETRDFTVDYLREHFPDLPEHVRLHDSDSTVNSYDLVASATAVLVYASTIGLESVLLGRPALVAGDVHYRGKGFTIDVEGREQLARLLERPDELRLTEEERDLAITYAHVFLFESMIDVPSLGQHRRGRPFFRVSDTQELEQDPGLQALCAAVLTSLSHTDQPASSSSQLS